MVAPGRASIPPCWLIASTETLPRAGGLNGAQRFPNLTPDWFAQAGVLSRSVIQNIGNAGYLANTTQGMLDRLQTDIIAHRPDKVFIMAGYSDIDYLFPVSTIIG